MVAHVHRDCLVQFFASATAAIDIATDNEYNVASLLKVPQRPYIWMSKYFLSEFSPSIKVEM